LQVKYNIETYTNKGPRKDNQDRLITEVTELGYIVAAIADGVGGNKSGDVAAELAVNKFLNLIHTSKNRRVRNIVLQVHHEVVKTGQENHQHKGMLTTLSGCVLGPNKIWFGHVGDSRIYIINRKQIRRLSNDHTEVNKLLQDGKITEEDIELYPRKNVITDALGMEKIPEIQSGSVSLEKGDCILLTTDGIHGVLSDNEIHKQFLKSKTLIEFKQNLMSSLRFKIITDNNSFVCLNIQDI